MPQKLALYYYDGCYFCHLVRRAIDRLGVDVELRNVISEPRHREALQQATGRRRVPVLRIDDTDGTSRWMPESRDIVAYLERRFTGEARAEPQR